MSRKFPGTEERQQRPDRAPEYVEQPPSRPDPPPQPPKKED